MCESTDEGEEERVEGSGLFGRGNLVLVTEINLPRECVRLVLVQMVLSGPKEGTIYSRWAHSHALSGQWRMVSSNVSGVEAQRGHMTSGFLVNQE